MTEDELIDSVFEKEGVTYGDPTTHPPIDQPTGAGGITLPTMTDFLGHKVTVEDLKALTKETARPVVKWKLRTLAVESGISKIDFEPLRLQMMDFAYNSGAPLAIRWLQRVVRVAVDGKMGHGTLFALSKQDGFLVNQALIAARLQMIDMWTDAEAKRKVWEEGLESRALSFSLLEV